MPLPSTRSFLDDALGDEIQRLVFGISRELKEAARTIRCCAELAEEKWEIHNYEAKELLQCIRDAAVRIQNLIEEGLALALTITSAPKTSRVEMGRSLQYALVRLKPAIEETGATVRSRKLPTATANSEGLSRVFETLIANAIQYRSERQPFIQVDCARSGSHWLISVSDNGIGIQPEYRERIFLPLARLHGQAERPGTGLGLAVCRRIVESYNGRIWVESTLGAGSTFYFTVPRAKRAGRVSAASPPATPQPSEKPVCAHRE
ncbi:MAG TPA: ATP-binding protein [Bryobacteraceae bacterium]|nr:ATP-binding protein [Bryobacteraceae bacterium]